MRTFTALMVTATLFIGLGAATAQNAPSNPPQNSSPNQINKSNLPNKNSGSESQAAAKSGSGSMNKQAKTIGNGKFCVETTPGGAWNCKFASMSACEKEGKPNNRQCYPNPKGATTGSR